MAFIYYSPGINKIKISTKEVLQMLRETNFSPDNPIVYQTKQIIEILNQISDIRGGYNIYEDVEIKIKEGKIKINNTVINPGRKICAYLKNSEKLAIFICTAGEKFSLYSDKYNKEDDFLKGYIIDTIGSLIAEKSADYIQSKLEKRVDESGLKITNRYSPGYCHWPVNDQKNLFTLLPENTCNISLSKSCLMIPIKSVSGIIGIGEKVKKKDYSCTICNDFTCIYRKLI